MRKLMTAVAFSAMLALGIWFALGSGASARQGPVHTARHSPTHVTKVVKAHPVVATVENNTQSGSQAEGPDPAGSENQSESSGESTETSGESAGANETDTHEDPNGQDVNHECPPNCDTANGEQP